MMESKNDLYRSEWLELVFAGRNKEYGAYELRKQNAATTTKGLLIGSALLLIGIIGPFIYSKVGYPDRAFKAVPGDEVITIKEYVLPAKIKEPELSKPKNAKPESRNITVLKFVSPEVVSDREVQEEIPSIADLQFSAIGSETILADPNTGVVNAIETDLKGNGQGGADQTSSNEPVGMGLLEKYPEFPGGQDAFNRYISKNLRYPMLARENNISGRVFVSFIIEKNGSLSNIEVLRGIGGGCDDEAIRVLKNAPSWTAGTQNGEKVRVAYTMPIFFQLAN